MNKQRQLIQKLIRQGIICAVILGVCVGVYFFTDAMLADSVPQKSNAEAALQKDKGEITDLNSRLEKSSVAEARFLAIQHDRAALDFSANNEALKDWLRNAKNQYRLSSNFKLSLTNEKPSDAKELTTTTYETLEHPGMKLEFGAMSDAHVFSFLQDLTHAAPGIIRLETLSMKRSGDLDTNNIEQMRIGATPYLIDAKIEFNWIGLKEKITKDKDAASGAPNAGAKP